MQINDLKMCYFWRQISRHFVFLNGFKIEQKIDNNIISLNNKITLKILCSIKLCVNTFITLYVCKQKKFELGVSPDFQIYGRHIVMTSPGFKLLRQLHSAHSADRLSQQCSGETEGITVLIFRSSITLNFILTFLDFQIIIHEQPNR